MQVRRELVECLQVRRGEIEQAVMARVCSFEDPAQRREPDYLEGLRSAVSHAVAYALQGVERGESRPAPIPTALFAQARRAARQGVCLDTVLRRYLAGYTLLGDFLHQAAEETGLLEEEAFVRLRREQAALLDRLLAAVAEEHGREGDSAGRSSSERRAELVRRILAGELLDGTELSYRLDDWHLGLIATGTEAAPALRELAGALDCRPLIVEDGEGGLWVWLGGREPLGSAEVAELAAERLTRGTCLALGEPAQGVEGWRFTHRQALRAWPLAQRGGELVVRYGEVALLASILQDEVLDASLRELYLAPLESERDGGAALRETLRAYLASGCNVSSAAAALAVSRRTVSNRLRRAEERLGRSVSSCPGEIAAALRLEGMSAGGFRNGSLSHLNVSH